MTNEPNNHAKVPHDPMAERSFLAAMLQDFGGQRATFLDLKIEDFYVATHAKIFEAALTVADRESFLDDVMVHNETKATGNVSLEYILELAQVFVNPDNASHYARIIRKHARERKIMALCSQMSDCAATNPSAIEEVAAALQEAVEDTAARKDSKTWKYADQLNREAFEHINTANDNPDAKIGLRTGFTELDDMLGGLGKRKVHMVGGLTGAGKTVFALNVAQSLDAQKAGAVAFVSLEMPAIELSMRILSNLSRIDSQRIKSAKIRDNEYPRLMHAMDAYSKMRFAIDEPCDHRKLADIEKSLKQIQENHGLGLIIVDYLTLIDTAASKETREQQVGQLSKQLRAMAARFDVPLICLAQFNRTIASRQDKRPALSDFRDSGQIEQDADVVLFVHRQDYGDAGSEHRGKAEIIVAKNRAGPIGSVHLAYFEEHSRFENLSTRTEAF